MIQPFLFDDRNRKISVLIVGATGGIGQALVRELLQIDSVQTIYALSRKPVSYKDQKIMPLVIDLAKEQSLIEAAVFIKEKGFLDLIIVATGFLHDDDVKPEKKLNDLSIEKFQKNFLINTIGPALCLKHFVPLLNKKSPSLVACLSARVGSISDNHLGGWYGYRAAKSALNMVIKTASIEINRTYKQACIIGLHPGTVDTSLSQPFVTETKNYKLFTPQQSAIYLLSVINGKSRQDSGQVFDWNNQIIIP